MRIFTATIAAAAILLGVVAHAQVQAVQPAADAERAGAEQVVGLFLATCIHYHGDTVGLRSFLTRQGAPPLPGKPGAMLLNGATGQVFDVSYQDTHLALVSRDDGSCDAVAEFADPDAVRTLLTRQFASARVALKQIDDSSDAQRPGVRHTSWNATDGAAGLHITATTSSSAAPQAALVLAPK